MIKKAHHDAQHGHSGPQTTIARHPMLRNLGRPVCEEATPPIERPDGIRRSNKVLAMLTAVLIVNLSGGTIPLAGIGPTLAVIPLEAVNFALGFSLYKISRSLVPTSRFEHLSFCEKGKKRPEELGSTHSLR
jgi:hypothetical protein